MNFKHKNIELYDLRVGGLSLADYSSINSKRANLFLCVKISGRERVQQVPERQRRQPQRIHLAREQAHYLKNLPRLSSWFGGWKLERRGFLTEGGTKLGMRDGGFKGGGVSEKLYVAISTFHLFSFVTSLDQSYLLFSCFFCISNVIVFSVIYLASYTFFRNEIFKEVWLIFYFKKDLEKSIKSKCLTRSHTTLTLNIKIRVICLNYFYNKIKVHVV